MNNPQLMVETDDNQWYAMSGLEAAEDPLR